MSDEHDIIMECCDDCGNEFEEGAMEYTNANDQYVCDDCSESYVTCYDCCDRIHENDSYYPESASDYYCEDCYYNNFTACHDCGYDMYVDDAIYHEGRDESYCENCVPPEDEVDWNVYSNNYVQENDDFVNPSSDNYLEDTFNDIKSKRYVGIEIETNYESEISNDDVTHYIKNKVRRTRIDSDVIIPIRDNAVHDGSVTSEEHRFGNEIVMQPRRGDRIFIDVETICGSLRQLDAYPSVKCGLHLHVDTRDYDWYHFSVLTLMTKLIEPHVYTWVPPSRLSGQWSRPVSQPVSDFRYICDRESFVDFFYDNGGFTGEKYNDKRYHGLNLHCHFQANQGTEIRYHGGTLNPDKIKHWTIFWTNVIDTCYDIAEELRHKGHLINYNSFGDTEMYKSLVNTKRGKVYKTLHSKYGRHSIEYGQSTDINQYNKDSELLRRYLRLPKKDKPYLVQPMLEFVRRRQEHSFMSIQSIFELFNIPTETQKFFQHRTEEILGRNDDHFQRCFINKKSVVEFDRQTMKFKHISSLPSQFLTIDTTRIAEDWLPFSRLKEITDDASVSDLREFVIPNVSEYQVRLG